MDKHTIPLLSLRQVNKSFISKADQLQILRNVDLDIYRGDTIAITGASGIGKSTFLNILGTLDKPDNGELLFDNQNLFSFNEEQLAEFRNLKIGFVFQFHYLLKGFSAIENVMIPGMIARENKKKVEKSALNMLERVGLARLSSHRVEDLSGGEQQRVALARALVLQPDILLADEPTGNLDNKNAQSVHMLMQELNQELGTTIVVVTHNNKLAQTMEKNLTLKDGNITRVF